MASPPSPDSWLRDDEPVSWGPVVEDASRLRPNEVLVGIVANLLGAPVEATGDKLLNMATRHRYVLVDMLSHTRHSTVFRAVDRLLARAVALKIHHEERDDDATWRVLFEARAMSRIEHPNVVRVFDVGEHDAWLYSVTELCDGDMRAWSAARAWPEVIARILEAGRGLAALHHAGLVHGDVKPANILIKSGTAKVADFGMSAPPGGLRKIGGTAGFIAPEVTQGRWSAGGDVFALACTAWSCLFGQPPFGHPSAGASISAAVLVLVERARNGEIVEPESPTRVPRAIVEIIRRGLDADPVTRPDLGRWLDELGAAHSAITNRRARITRLVSFLASALLLMCLGAGGHAIYERYTAPKVPEPAPLREPQSEASMVEVLELAANDEPLNAWAAYWTVKKAQMPEVADLLELATVLMLDAENGKAAQPTISAEVCGRVARDARAAAVTLGLIAEAFQALEIASRCDTLLSRSSPPSRRD